MMMMSSSCPWHGVDDSEQSLDIEYFQHARWGRCLRFVIVMDCRLVCNDGIIRYIDSYANGQLDGGMKEKLPTMIPTRTTTTTTKKTTTKPTLRNT